MSNYSFQSDYEIDDYYNDYDDHTNSAFDDDLDREVPFIFNGDDSQSSQDVLTDEYSWGRIKEIRLSRNHVAETMRDETLENVKNQYNNKVMVKVDGVIHHLNRIQLALKSDYFEKLLTGDFNEKESQLVEIHSIDGPVFSCIIELINKKKLESVINTDNYIELLMAMDYLQMEINLKPFGDIIINKFLNVPLKKNSNIFVLHDFVALQDKKFEYLLRVVRGYLSIHLTELYDCPEYLSFSADQLVQIITRNKFPEYTSEKKQIGRICAKWICHDIENRFSLIVDLVNAARYRYDVYYRVHLGNVKIPCSFPDNKAETKLAAMEKHFNRLLNFDGEIDPALEKSEEHEYENKTHCIINKIDENQKWAEFLENEYFYDVTIKAGGKIFKLHRFMLAFRSDYFLHVFAEDFSKAAQSGNSSNFMVDRDAEYLLEEIDSVTFGVLIKFLYFGENNWSSLSNLEIVRLIKADIILKVDALIACLGLHISFHSLFEKIDENFIELMNFIYGNETYEEFYTTLRGRIIASWPEIVNTPQCYSISLDVLENILASENFIVDGLQILDFCSKWIAHDAKNRFSFLTRISVAINRNYMMNTEAFHAEIPKDWNSCSEQFIKDRLWDILCLNTLVPSKTDIKCEDPFKNPKFVAAKGKTLDILDSVLQNIASIRSPECPCSFLLNVSGNSYFNISFNEKFQSSAIIINNNLFIVYVTEKKSFFQVYNLLSTKLIALASDHRMHSDRKITLLNCNGQVYCCFEDGLILRYVVELNRWTMFLEGKLNDGIKIKFVFASNEHVLFKVPQLKDAGRKGIPEAYDFEQNSWITLPDLPTEFSSSSFYKRVVSATTVNDNLTVLFPRAILLLDHQSQLVK